MVYYVSGCSGYLTPFNLHSGGYVGCSGYCRLCKIHHSDFRTFIFRSASRINCHSIIILYSCAYRIGICVSGCSAYLSITSVFCSSVDHISFCSGYSSGPAQLYFTAVGICLKITYGYLGLLKWRNCWKSTRACCIVCFYLVWILCVIFDTGINIACWCDCCYFTVLAICSRSVYLISRCAFYSVPFEREWCYCIWYWQSGRCGKIHYSDFRTLTFRPTSRINCHSIIILYSCAYRIGICVSGCSAYLSITSVFCSSVDHISFCSGYSSGPAQLYFTAVGICLKITYGYLGLLKWRNCWKSTRACCIVCFYLVWILCVIFDTGINIACWCDCCYFTVLAICSRSVYLISRCVCYSVPFEREWCYCIWYCQSGRCRWFLYLNLICIIRICLDSNIGSHALDHVTPSIIIIEALSLLSAAIPWCRITKIILAFHYIVCAWFAIHGLQFNDYGKFLSLGQR